MRKKGWVLLLVLLSVAFLMSCGKGTEPDEAKGELVRIERGMPKGILLFFYTYALTGRTNVFIKNTQNNAKLPLENSTILEKYNNTILKFKMLLD